MEDDNLDRVRICVENNADPTSRPSFNEYLTRHCATSAFLEIFELLTAWGAEVKGKSALIIASHNGRANLVILLLKDSAEINEKRVIHWEGIQERA